MRATNIKFKYKSSRCENYLCFRPGDLVKVSNWGGIYSCYKSAFMHFNNSCESPYYCQSAHNWNVPRNRLFKIVDVAEHTDFSDRVICYIIDNEKRGAVIDADALRPFKVYPLRENEKKEIELKRIMQI